MAAHSTGRLFARRPFLRVAAVIDACRGEAQDHPGCADDAAPRRRLHRRRGAVPLNALEEKNLGPVALDRINAPRGQSSASLAAPTSKYHRGCIALQKAMLEDAADARPRALQQIRCSLGRRRRSAAGPRRGSGSLGRRLCFGFRAQSDSRGVIAPATAPGACRFDARNSLLSLSRPAAAPHCLRLRSPSWMLRRAMWRERA